MWNALGNAFDTLQNTHEAIKCYKRALISGQCEPRDYYKLGQLYHKIDDSAKAKYFFSKYKEQGGGDLLDEVQMYLD